MSPIYAYWKIRGLAHPIRLVLTYAGEEFEDKVYECGSAPDYDRSCWTNEKFSLNLDFPNLPYYIDGNLKLTQSSAIIRHLARKYHLDGKTEEEKTRIDVLDAEIQDLRKNFANLCYGANFEQEKAGYLKNLPAAIKQLSAFLGDRKYFAGENLSYVDFMTYEYFFHLKQLNPAVIDDYANLKNFYERIEALPRISEYVKTAPASKYALNNKSAKFGDADRV